MLVNVFAGDAVRAIFAGVLSLALSVVVPSLAQAVETPRCSDGIDNDLDGKKDFPADPDCIAAFDESENGDHPFIIVTKDRYAELRTRAASAPWSDWKTKAISDCKSHVIRSGVEAHQIADDITMVINGCSLAYILDPANKGIYTPRFKTAMDAWSTVTLPYEMNFGTKPCTNGLIMSLTGLDIFYDEIDSITRSKYENTLDSLCDTNKVPRVGTFSPGAEAVWNIYKKNASGVLTYINQYDDVIFGSGGMISSDGFFNDGPMYGWTRHQFPNSLATGIYFDIVTFSGHRNYYADSRVRDFYDWLFHFGASPPLTHTVFAEARIGHYDANGMGESLLLWISERWSEEINRHSAWMVNELKRSPKYTLYTYSLMKNPLPSPLKPTSKIYFKGGAGFWERNISRQSLMGALWSQTRTSQHSRKEPNNLNIMGFGEYMLVNAGYARWGESCKDNTTGIVWPWNWFREDPKSENTITIGTNEIFGIVTNGVKEGLVSDLFDYASGDSGSAIPNGTHQRNFIMVHPEANENQGYFVLFDEVHSSSPSQEAFMHLHPNSFGPTTIADGKEYRFTIDMITAENQKQEYLSIFYGTAPAAVTFPNGGIAFAQKEDGCYTAKYPKAKFVTNAQGNKSMVTVLFPHDISHPKANMTRLSGTGFSGARIDHSTSSDYATESDGAAVVSPLSGVNYQGKASLFRASGTSNKFYFVRRGRSFSMSNVGFTSSADVSVYMRGQTGKIVSPGATVTFMFPGITGVKLNGGSDQGASLFIPAGTHDVSLVVGQNPPPAAPKNLRVVP
ncbi:MAG: hypothetical protein IT291_11275 [Deltaproteobacteria bacterium]|nr:hypothetical protein [Deltaproteobacteria bacterium]